MHRNIARVTLIHVPLDVVCDVMTFFESVEEVTCMDIRDPQQVCLCIMFVARRHTVESTSFECSSSLKRRVRCYTYPPAAVMREKTSI